jgi:heme exporter protein D
MSELSAFFQMGGYARYVWPAYGLTLLVLAANVLIPLWRERAVRRLLARRYARERT